MNIVCTGYGVLAPKTANVEEFLFNLKNGVCCLDYEQELTPHNEKNIVGIIKEGIEKFESDKKLDRLPRATKLGMVATEEAVKSARIDLKNKRVGLFFGTAIGGISEQVFQDSFVNARKENFKKIPVVFPHSANYNSITSAIGHYIGTNGITKTISTGCTSSLEAIEEALVYLKIGIIDVAIVGGVDTPLSKPVTYGFARTRVLPFNQDMTTGAVPFQDDSNGFAMAEASGAIVLERNEDAMKRGADIKGEITDIVSNNDGTYLFSTDETGNQIAKALKEVTNGRKPDYVNSQALGISVNDRIEMKCSKELFNHQVPYTSIKSMYGNPLGASGIVQVIASLLSIEHNFIPPTIRTTKKGYEDMNIVTQTKYQEVNEVVVTNHGYGGNNVCAYITSPYL